MKTYLIIFLSTLLSSCFGQPNKTEELDRRVTVLEQKIDSMNKGANSYSPSTLISTNNGTYSSANAQCKAITKKGKACKRKGKYSGYCWQHQG